MNNAFKVEPLAKTDQSLTRNPDTRKYYLQTCKSRITAATPTTAPWLKVMDSLKLSIRDEDKSRVMLGALDTYGEIVIKIGNTKEIQREYETSYKLRNVKGYVKYICYFECNDNFREHPSSRRDTLCKGPGDTMKVILMPYFPLGSIHAHKWTPSTIHILHSCLKHAILSMLYVFQTMNIVHGDFHSGNLLLKHTSQTSISYSIPGIGDFPDMKLFGMRPWIMDFENSHDGKHETRYDTIMTLSDVYFDMTKLFTTLHSDTNNIDKRFTTTINALYKKPMQDGAPITKKLLESIFAEIDLIQCDPRVVLAREN